MGKPKGKSEAALLTEALETATLVVMVRLAEGGHITFSLPATVRGGGISIDRDSLLPPWRRRVDEPAESWEDIVNLPAESWEDIVKWAPTRRWPTVQWLAQPAVFESDARRQIFCALSHFGLVPERLIGIETVRHSFIELSLTAHFNS